MGYALFQIPGGIAGAKFGPRRACGYWLGLDFRLRLDRLLPGTIATTTGGTIFVLVILRFILGGTRTHLPSAGLSGAALVSSWAMGLTQCSVELCSDLGCCTGATVSRINYGLLGWRASFYVFVPAGIAAFALWWWYARDYPSEHPAMTPGELK